MELFGVIENNHSRDSVKGGKGQGADEIADMFSISCFGSNINPVKVRMTGVHQLGTGRTGATTTDLLEFSQIVIGRTLSFDGHAALAWSSGMTEKLSRTPTGNQRLAQSGFSDKHQTLGESTFVEKVAQFR
jgi:hypothetical protein